MKIFNGQNISQACLCGLFMMLACSYAALPAQAAITCELPKAPRIEIKPVSQPVRFDYSKTSTELAALKSDSASPYAPGTDSATGGLRHDTPQIRQQMKWGVMEYPAQKQACLWYDSITVTIDLKPKIYIARDKKFSDPVCREAIIAHEKKHVAVDRAVINSYAAKLGKVIRGIVNETGAVGPVPLAELDTAQAQLVEKIETVMDQMDGPRDEAMTRHQAEVDSLEEYQRLSRICDVHRPR